MHASEATRAEMRVVCTVSGDRRIAGRLLTRIAAVASDLARVRLDSTVVKEQALSSTVFVEIREMIDADISLTNRGVNSMEGF